MKEIRQGLFVGERALYDTRDAVIDDSTFMDGESPLKESRNLILNHCIFKWKYPLWYCHDVVCNDTTLLETARSGIWYTHNITMNNCHISAPKTFRKSSGIKLINCNLPNAIETLWNCEDITLKNVYILVKVGVYENKKLSATFCGKSKTLILFSSAK